MNEEQKNMAAGELLATDGSKKAYSPPTLTLFGHVAALTQSGTCSALNDGLNCPSSGGGTMSAGMTPSDRRLKQDIVRIGDHPAGFGLYLFSYLPAYRDECGHARQFGVMADEVEQVFPAAVITRADGFKAVHYDMLGIRGPVH